MLCKRATVLLYKNLAAKGYVFGKTMPSLPIFTMKFKYRQRGTSRYYRPRSCQSLRAAGEYYDFRCPITGEYKSAKLGRDALDPIKSVMSADERWSVIKAVHAKDANNSFHMSLSIFIMLTLQQRLSAISTAHGP